MLVESEIKYNHSKSSDSSTSSHTGDTAGTAGLAKLATSIQDHAAKLLVENVVTVMDSADSGFTSL